MPLRLQEAAESIAFYRQVDVKSKIVEAEIARIKMEIDPKLQTILDNTPGKIVPNETLV